MPVSRKTAESKIPPNKLVPYWKSECGRAVVYVGDCREVMVQMEPDQFHAVVTDPPYELISSTPSAAYHVRAAKKDKGGVPNTGNWDSTGVAFDMGAVSCGPTSEMGLRIKRNQRRVVNLADGLPMLFTTEQMSD